MLKINYNSLGETIELMIKIEDTYYQLPWNNGIFDWDSIEYESTRTAIKSAWDEWATDKDLVFELRNRPDLTPLLSTPEPDWAGLQNRGLGGDLHPIFNRLTLAAFTSNSPGLVGARGDILAAITTVKVEAALASGLALLSQFGYAFTEEEKLLWNTAITELGFSDLVKI